MINCDVTPRLKSKGMHRVAELIFRRFPPASSTAAVWVKIGSRPCQPWLMHCNCLICTCHFRRFSTSKHIGSKPSFRQQIPPFGVLPTEHNPLFMHSSHIRLACRKSNQSLVTVSGDGDNSLSSRWVKFASRGSMNQAAGAGGGWHPTATTWGGE